ncbi:MAG: hypothetical protein AB7F91_04515 [Parvularculaceae bacterium]
MKQFIGPGIIAALLVSGAAAQEGPPPPDRIEEGAKPPEHTAPNENDAGRLIAFAREKRTKEGCAAAAPSFRVLAGMGEGQEAAQHELGECLLTMTGASDVETALFRQEGEFWLTRAAYAGNARAQRKLAMTMASPASPLHNPKASLQWSLIYSKNPTADVYGYGPLPGTLVPGLKSALTGEEIAEAEAFAKDFAPITLPKFEGPNREEGKKRGDRPKGGRPPGGRRGPGLSS